MTTMTPRLATVVALLLGSAACVPVPTPPNGAGRPPPHMGGPAPFGPLHAMGGQGYGRPRHPGPVVAPRPGSVLPPGMVPGEWTATGNSRTVRHGERIDTKPRPCVRFGGVQGECGWKKRE